jgi:hypothetical protein
MKKYHIIIILISIIFAGCSGDNELQDSVYIHDPMDRNLPVYSEWGYNTFGAYYDRTVFISSDDIVPAKVVTTNNSTFFILSGQQSDTFYRYGDHKNMSIKFELRGFDFEDYLGLVALNLSVHNLYVDPLLYEPKVTIVIDEVEYPAQVIEGSLTFKRAQNLSVDMEQIEVILSGQFDFKALVNNMPVTISDGRFDVGVGANNFYRY